jgi:hypothetical protein
LDYSALAFGSFDTARLRQIDDQARQVIAPRPNFHPGDAKAVWRPPMPFRHSTDDKSALARWTPLL